MKKYLLSALALFACIVLTGCSVAKPNFTGTNNLTGSYDGGISTKKTDIAKLEKNISTTAAVDLRGKLIVILKNSNKVSVRANITAEFYDEAGTIVGSGKDELYCFGANSEAAVELYDTPSSFKTYKVYVDVEQDDLYNSKRDKISITDNKTDEKVVAQVTNNSNDTISYIDAAIVYYQGDKIVGYDSSIEDDVKPGRAANFNFSNPYDKNYDDISFDNYKIFINGAYTSKY